MPRTCTANRSSSTSRSSSAEWLGISPALGAFAAGLVVGDTEFIHEIEGILRPFRDFLSSLFFTSIGMLLDPAFVFRSPLLVLTIVLGVIAVKVAAACSWSARTRTSRAPRPPRARLMGPAQSSTRSRSLSPPLAA